MPRASVELIDKTIFCLDTLISFEPSGIRRIQPTRAQHPIQMGQSEGVIFISKSAQHVIFISKIAQLTHEKSSEPDLFFCELRNSSVVQMHGG